MTTGRNKRYDVVHWGVFVLFAIGTSTFLVTQAKDIEGKFDQITTNQREIMLMLEDTKITDQSDQSGSVTPTEEAIETSSSRPHYVIKTSKGDITVELFADQTPKTVANFVSLIEQDFYTDIKFHRVIPGFMVQVGDPLTKDDSLMAQWGTGGPGYAFDDEIFPTNSNIPGTLSMANAGANTNGSQFFINTADNTRGLDQKHTVFGKVIKGMDIVGLIESVPTEGPNRPVEAVTILDIGK